MKKALTIGFALVFGLCFAHAAFAADEAAIKSNVDQIVAGINEGKVPSDYKPNDYAPYVFVMDRKGMLLVHPKLKGQSLNTEQYRKVYQALSKAVPEGVWVEYEWSGCNKKSYVKTTDNGLIVGSGYSE